MTNQDASPLMRQYRDIKRGYPQAILFFRVGDFYEMFYSSRPSVNYKVLPVHSTLHDVI